MNKIKVNAIGDLNKKVLVHGDPNRIKGKIRKFECHYCGCIFEADRKGYDINIGFTNSSYGNNMNTFYDSVCPECGDAVSVIEAREINGTAELIGIIERCLHAVRVEIKNERDYSFKEPLEQLLKVGEDVTKYMRYKNDETVDL